MSQSGGQHHLLLARVRLPYARCSVPQVQSLRKYAKMYDIHGNASNASKEELLGLVRDHFAMQRIEEQEVLLNLQTRHQRGM